jgi:hypothetical protein
MTFLNKLERHFGWIAIGNLPLYVVSAQAILYLWAMVNPGQEALLTMEPNLVRAGEYWRVFTFLFLVPFSHPLWAALYLYFQFICGQALENEWGSFRLTVFYLTGAIGCIAAAFIAGYDLQAAFYLNETVFLAFAALYPDFQILLFFILPIRIKWIAWISWARIAYGIFGAPWLLKLAILVSLSNYILFFSAGHARWVVDFVQRKVRRHKYRDFNG